MHRRGVWVTPSAVSRHLRILRENQAVIVRAEWVNRLYRLDPRFLKRLKSEVRHLQERWKRRYGVMARDNDWTKVPAQIALHVGERKGKRGKLHRDDVWRIY